MSNLLAFPFSVSARLPEGKSLLLSAYLLWLSRHKNYHHGLALGMGERQSQLLQVPCERESVCGGCYSGHCSTPVICTGMELARVKQVPVEWLTPVFSPLENRINLVSPLKQLCLRTPTLLQTQTLQWTSVQNGESMNHV